MKKWKQLLTETKYVMADNEPKLVSILPNLNEISFGNFKLFFSYGRMIGFSKNGKMSVVSNLNESKFGKHIDYINEKDHNFTKMSYDQLINTFNRVLAS